MTTFGVDGLVSAVVGMTPDQREVWFNLNIQKIFEHVPVDALLDARKVLDATIEAKLDAAIIEVDRKRKQLAEHKAMLASKRTGFSCSTTMNYGPIVEF
jgi:hypothetical protein